MVVELVDASTGDRDRSDDEVAGRMKGDQIQAAMCGRCLVL